MSNEKPLSEEKYKLLRNCEKQEEIIENFKAKVSELESDIEEITEANHEYHEENERLEAENGKLKTENKEKDYQIFKLQRKIEALEEREIEKGGEIEGEPMLKFEEKEPEQEKKGYWGNEILDTILPVF